MAKSICALRANETGRQASARMPARDFLIEDPAGSQGQTGNNGFFASLLLFRETVQFEAEEAKERVCFAALLQYEARQTRSICQSFKMQIRISSSFLMADVAA